MPKCIRERLFAKLDRESQPGCWLWTGATGGSSRRYGVIGSGVATPRLVSTHRLSWELHRGPIPDGMSVLHNCPGGDNSLCCNPDHLFLGTHRENMRDMVHKQRRASGYSIARNRSTTKLTPDDVRAIRALLRDGLSQGAIAGRFQVSQQTVSLIGSGKTWAHVT